MKIVSLVSAVDQNIDEMLDGMRLETDAVIVNQCRDVSPGVSVAAPGIKVITMNERGVGLSRNTCMDNAPDCDVVLFTDEDIMYDGGYSDAISSEYAAHPEAEAILFNMRVCEARRTYWNEDFGRVRFYNYGRYPAYSISVKSDVLKESGVRFPLDFGGGAKYANGEDSIFLHDLLKTGVRIYRSAVCLGEEKERESTWFTGYDDRFWISRGALYVRLYGAWASFRAHVFLLRHGYMHAETGYGRAYALMKQGMREVRRTYSERQK